MEFYATCPSGLEDLLAGELRDCGAQGVRPLRGQVAFAGELEEAYRACLACRTASRVVALIERVDAKDSDSLYASLMAIPWEQHLSPTTSYAVDATGTNNELRNTRFVELRVKDAVSDRMRERTGSRPATDVRAPEVRLAVRVREDRASVGVDLCGEPLFRRGYERRDEHGLRPDYAAALLLSGGWDASGSAIVLPGDQVSALAVEAAGIACGQAPGLLRRRWGFDSWRGHDAAAWSRAVAWAQARQELPAEPVRVLCDNPQRCRDVLRTAGLSEAATPLALEKTPAKALVGGSVLFARDLTWVREDDLPRQAAELSSLAHVGDTLPGGAHVAVLARDGLADASPRAQSRCAWARGRPRCARTRCPSPAPRLRPSRCAMGRTRRSAS